MAPVSARFCRPLQRCEELFCHNNCSHTLSSVFANLMKERFLCAGHDVTPVTLSCGGRCCGRAPSAHTLLCALYSELMAERQRGPLSVPSQRPAPRSLHSPLAACASAAPLGATLTRASPPGD